jgi:hypothetical protein
MTVASALRAFLAVVVLLGLAACASAPSAPPSGTLSGSPVASPSAPAPPASSRAVSTSQAPQVTQAPPTTQAPTPTQAAPAGCYPLSNEGTCYEPGEFCRKSDHGVTGVAGDGKTIKCEDNDGWRWEPI